MYTKLIIRKWRLAIKTIFVTGWHFGYIQRTSSIHNQYPAGNLMNKLFAIVITMSLAFTSTFVQAWEPNVTDKLEILPEFFVSSWVSGLWNSLSANAWSYLSIGFFFFFLALMSLYLYSKLSRIKKLGFFLSILCLLSSLLFYNFASKMKV